MKNFMLVSLILCMICYSCASFDRKMIKDDLNVVTKNDAQLIEGKYEFNGYEHVGSDRKKTEKIKGFARMLDLNNKAKLNECDKVEISLKPLNKNKHYELQFTLSEKDSARYVFKYNAKLKNGLFLLKNYTSKCHGIPYLFGGCLSFQSRIGLTKDKNLLVQDYYDNSGAALFIMWAGYSINYAEKYKRIQ